MKIAFFPYESTENKYANIIITILKSIEGVEVYPFVPSRYLRLSRRMWNADVVWLNWFELDHGTAKNILKILVLFLLRIFGRKIIYTLHNRKLHNKDTSTLSKILQRSLYYFCDVIIIHSKVSVQEVPKKYVSKTRYIPHPNYIGEYGEIIKTKAEVKLKLLFLGQIKPYKNIELLITTLSELNSKEVELTIVGKPISDGYKQELINLAKGKGIRFVFEFVKDEDINKYLGECDLLILPYDISSSLNSGTVILAFSYGRSIICPLIGTVSDLESDAFFAYTYHNRFEHQIALKKEIQKAIELKLSDIEVFNKWGEIMYNDVLINNSRNRIKEIIEQNILK
jgi:beta-1,4-mannosyltransferase